MAVRTDAGAIQIHSATTGFRTGTILQMLSVGLFLASTDGHVRRWNYRERDALSEVVYVLRKNDGRNHIARRQEMGRNHGWLNDELKIRLDN